MSPGSLVAGCAGSYAGAHHGVVRGCTCVQSQAAVLLPLALLARRGLRRLLRCRAPRCGVRLHLCAVSGGGALACRPARSSRAALAFYAGAHHSEVIGCTRAISGGGASVRCPACSSRAAPAPTLTRTTVGTSHAAPGQFRFCPSPCSLVAGRAAHHSVVRGCTSVQS